MPDDKSVFKTFNLYCILFKKLMAPIGHLTKTEQKANASTAAVVSFSHHQRGLHTRIASLLLMLKKAPLIWLIVKSPLIRKTSGSTSALTLVRRQAPNRYWSGCHITRSPWSLSAPVNDTRHIAGQAGLNRSLWQAFLLLRCVVRKHQRHRKALYSLRPLGIQQKTVSTSSTMCPLYFSVSLFIGFKAVGANPTGSNTGLDIIS